MPKIGHAPIHPGIGWQIVVEGETDVKRARCSGSDFGLRLLICLAVAALVGGCGRGAGDNVPLEQVVPAIPSNTSFGPLYPRLNELLKATPPDITAAVRETRAWAEAKLEDFGLGACAQTQIVPDADFSRIFGRTTLGVTLPWMLIFVRDGNRGPDPFLWSDASLFVSTILHEYVHARQRVQQAHDAFGANDCLSARQLLATRQGAWAQGFETLKKNAQLGSSFDAREKALLYHWSSPIERARDEVEASLVTVKWMDGHRDELNAYTIGGANNWAYALQFLNQLKTLSSSNCYSPDEGEYREEQRIYAEDVPRYLGELQAFEAGMRALLRTHNIPALSIELRELRSAAIPTGRLGSACNNAALTQLPLVTPDNHELDALLSK